MGRQAQKIKTYQKIKREAAKAYNEETGDDSSWTRILSLLTSCSPSTAAGRPGKTIDDTLNERIGSQQQKSRSRSSGHSAQREKRHPSLAYHWIRAGEIDIGFGYIVVEELVAIVDPRTRKFEIVFPRWAEQ
jgi:hypothetical protein